MKNGLTLTLAHHAAHNHAHQHHAHVAKQVSGLIDVISAENVSFWGDISPYFWHSFSLHPS
jgi:hypothetical protein